MKEGSLDIVSRKVKQRFDAISTKARSNFEGIKPFGKVQRTPEEEIFYIEDSGYLDDPKGFEKEYGQGSFATLVDMYRQLQAGRR